LPTPIDDPHPAANRPLFEAIIDGGGGWLSESSGTVTRSSFRVRNRLIAALADVVVVVEAGERSGTRHTIRAARTLGRIVAAVPGAVGDPAGTGCNEILKNGGRAVRCAKDVLALLGKRPRAQGARAPPPARPPPEIGGDLAVRIMALVEDGEVSSVDALARAL